MRDPDEEGVAFANEIRASAGRYTAPTGRLVASTTSTGNSQKVKSGFRMPHRYLAPAAAALPLPADVALKAPEQWKLIGQPDTPRIEIALKCTGKADYGVDVRVPNMLHAAVQHSPVLGGKVVSFDETAKSKKGVKDIISLGFGVAVVADNEWTARSVARDLKVTWDNGANANYNTDQMAKDYQAAIANTQGAIAKKTGDVDAAMKAAGAKVVEADYVIPYLYHATMEPHN